MMIVLADSNQVDRYSVVGFFILCFWGLFDRLDTSLTQQVGGEIPRCVKYP